MALAALNQDQLAISAISFWEMALLVAKGRFKSLDSAARMREQVLQGVSPSCRSRETLHSGRSILEIFRAIPPTDSSSQRPLSMAQSS